MIAEFQADTAQYQQPQDNHQRQIETAESGGIEQRERKIQRSASGDKPNLVSIPDRTDRTQGHAAFVLGLREKWIEDAHPKIKTVKHHVGDQHNRHKPEPNEAHIQSSPVLISGRDTLFDVALLRGGAIADFSIDQHDEEDAQQGIETHEAEKRE